MTQLECVIKQLHPTCPGSSMHLILQVHLDSSSETWQVVTSERAQLVMLYM